MSALAHIQTIAADRDTLFPEIPAIAGAFVDYVNNSSTIARMDDALTSAYVSLDAKVINDRRGQQIANMRRDLALADKHIRTLTAEDDVKTKKISDLEEKISNLEGDVAVLQVKNNVLECEIKELKEENIALKCEIKDLKDEKLCNKVYINIRQLIVNVQFKIFSEITRLTERQLKKEQISTFSDLEEYISDLKEEGVPMNERYATIKTNMGLTFETIKSFNIIRRNVNDNVHPDDDIKTLLECVKNNLSVAFPFGKATKHDAEMVCAFVERNAELF